MQGLLPTLIRFLNRDRGIFARFTSGRRIPPLSRDRGILSFHSRYDKGLQFASEKTTVVLRIYPESPRDSYIGRTILKVVTNTFTTVTWLEYCRYGENPPKSNQYIPRTSQECFFSLCACLAAFKTDRNPTTGTCNERILIENSTIFVLLPGTPSHIVFFKGTQDY